MQADAGDPGRHQRHLDHRRPEPLDRLGQDLRMAAQTEHGRQRDAQRAAPGRGHGLGGQLECRGAP